MTGEANLKVKTEHLARNAYLYIRQSTPRQVLENTESAQRQYALRQRAVAMGWRMDQVIVIDGDQGHSGASAADREGFQKLVAEVGLGHAGIVLGLEVSRLARNLPDWHRLLEICGLTDTLILDEDGVYDPTNFNDRLLLGLKGTMSEAELHLLYARMQGGRLSKARRGELRCALPIGLAYSERGEVILDPDAQIRESVQHLLAAFRREGSVWAVARSSHRQGLLFPKRLRGGPRKGEVVWTNLNATQAVHILRSPRYAGAYVYGRTQIRKKPDGTFKSVRKLRREDWEVLLLNAHPGYITWEEYEANQRRLDENAQFRSEDRKQIPPREGPALLQGIALCGQCGERMMTHYRIGKHGLVPEYFCIRKDISDGVVCQQILSRDLDPAIGKLLMEAMNPLALEVAMEVQKEIQDRLEEADRLRQARVERAHYEAQLAQRRYMRCDPDNRLVADALEADWNENLRSLRAAREEYERQRDRDRLVVGEEQRAKILALATDFPRLWTDPHTPHRERKRVVRLLVDDVTLIKDWKEIVAHVRFKGGATRTITVPRPQTAVEIRQTSPEVVAEIDQLTNQQTPKKIAAILNERGSVSGTGHKFTALLVIGIQQRYGLKPLRERLREQGLLTPREAADRLGISLDSVSRWRRKGLIRGHVYNDRGDVLCEDPGRGPMLDARGRVLPGRRRLRQTRRPSAILRDGAISSGSRA